MKGLRKLKIELSEAEFQTIFNALLDRPFKEVFALIQKMQDVYKDKGGEERMIAQTNAQRHNGRMGGGASCSFGGRRNGP